MRALHIDAFFEYLVGKNPPYCRQIPPIDAPYPEQRDGVPIEEDLAIRALDPKFRPKRGRRKADDQDDDMEPQSAIDPKRPQLDTSVGFGSVSGYPQSANPASAMGMSAHPDDLMHGVDPWAAAGLTPGGQLKANQNIRWRLGSQDPQTPHPMSALTPMSAQPPDSVFDEPQSAITPSSKKRRRHGPAVSSAWPSSTTTSNGRLRGRPPSNRSVRDGPFVTFPVNPTAKEQTIDITRNKPSPEAARAVPTSQSIQQNPTPVSATPPHHPPPATQTRPERLQLQVPQHVGGPIHLVTPTVLVNGEMSPPQQPAHLPSASTANSARSGASGMSFFSTDSSIPGSSTTTEAEHVFLTPRSGVTHHGTPLRALPMHQVHAQATLEKAGPSISNEDLKRALAADLLRGDISGRGGKRLRGSEAKELAECLLCRLRSQAVESPAADAANDTLNLTCATWLGLCSLPALHVGASAGLNLNVTGGTKKIYVQRYRVGRDGYDSPIDEDDDPRDERTTTGAEAEGEIRETFDVEWSSSLGGLSGHFSVKGLTIGKGGEEDAGVAGRNGRAGRKESLPEDNVSATVWKQRYLAAERKLRESREEVGNLRDKVLEVVL
jgi:ARS binding protein 2